ncbi:hypothetical protein DICVIV_05996 [Dictyocaulus viviparus]|uniref:Uncharacterized protein n=1 Tax=Dictyocaulus viviparus TaxID=29172 RepID=A0A0D8XVX3_DICVI|nr:hypothetical protein DICVIV_05996 [Dictyocaulus viviparus]
MHEKKKNLESIFFIIRLVGHLFSGLHYLMITMKSISFMACTILLQASEKRQVVTANLQVQQYSFPPNNTPISKVYIFGRPIYVRQPFVLPQRDIYRSRIEQKDEGAFSVQALEKSNTESRDDLLNNAFEKQLYGDTNPTRYYLPERPYTTPYDTVREPVYTQTKTIYPLPQCYTNDSGFMCCNSELEQVMKDVLNELTSDSKWQSCNVQKIANVLQIRIVICNAK